MSAYEFLIKMKDYASSGLQQIAESAGLADRRINTVGNSVDSVNKRSKRFGSTLGNLKRIIATAFATIGIAAFVNKTIDARAEYEKFEAVLTNTFGSVEVGQGALNMLTDFASKTPYQLNELTGSFVQLVNRGFQPGIEELTKMGDLASSQGKSFSQLSEAILDAETNEFERLKEFGIKTKKAGAHVQFTFKGITKTVDANSKSIRKAILEYGGMKGVAGSMEAISKTLGGRLSNLKDQFWSLLVTVGGQSNGVLVGVIDSLSSGIAFLSGHVAHISIWFQQLWRILKPVGITFLNLIKSVTGFTDAGIALNSFTDIASSALLVLDVLATGLITVINWLMPLSDVIGVVTVAWVGLNIAFSISPIGWIVIGITTLIGVIGLAVKYTNGWGDSWRYTFNGAKLLFKSYTLFVKANFNTMIQELMIGIDKIKLGWYKFKETVGIGDSNNNQKMIAQINASVEKRKQSIQQGYKDMIEIAKKSKEEFSKVGVSIDKKGLKNDLANLKAKFSGIGQKDKSAQAYLDFRQNGDKTSQGGVGLKGDKTKNKKDMIVSGGNKQTNVTVHIGKLQDKIEIHVSNTEKGVDNLGSKVREELLRAINSVNQMQTV